MLWRLETINLNTIKEMVEIESPSTDRDACNRMALYIEKRLNSLGMAVKRVQSPDFGDHIIAEFPEKSENLPYVFLLGHYDTVWPIGEIKKRPVQLKRNIMSGHHRISNASPLPSYTTKTRTGVAI